jgi:NAD(P)-dependent dehydrogenase (short-subunit alcohol dehydrogenase family)
MTLLDFTDRVAVVTGAGRGLGRSHALALAERGARVVVNDVGGSLDGLGSSSGPAQVVVDEIVAAGGSAVADGSDIATPEGAEALIQRALDEFGRVDIVINNAGILRDRSLKNMSVEDFDVVLAVHLRGSFLVSRAAWPHFQEAGYGRLVNTTSVAGLLGNFGQANYGAAKAGLVGLTKVQAIEGAKYGIKANALEPAARTRMTEDLLGDLVERLAPELATAAAVWLAHEDCPVSGDVINAGGGRVARVFWAQTQGYFAADMRPEDVRDHWAEICDKRDLAAPSTFPEELELLTRHLRVGASE